MSVYLPRAPRPSLVRVDTATERPSLSDLDYIGLRFVRFFWIGVFLLLFIVIFSYMYRRCTLVGSCMLFAHRLKCLPRIQHKIVFSSSHSYYTRALAVAIMP